MARNTRNLHQADATAGAKYKGDTFAVDDSMLFTELPPTPENMTEDAAFWWQYYGGLFIEAKAFSRMFYHSVANYCRLCGTATEIEKQLHEEGTFRPVIVKVSARIAAETGETEYVEQVYNPLNEKLQKLYEKLDHLANSLGMTPYSSKVLAIDATGSNSEDSAPQPPEVHLSPETLPFTEGQSNVG